MRAIDFISEHEGKVVFWNIRRFNEENAEWDLIDPAEIEDEEMVDEAFFGSTFEENDTCDLYLV
jgi:hypothetical protein